LSLFRLPAPSSPDRDGSIHPDTNHAMVSYSDWPGETLLPGTRTTGPYRSGTLVGSVSVRQTRGKRGVLAGGGARAGMAHATSEYGEWPLRRLMTEVVGSGHKSADDMDRDQAREAMARILDGEPDHTTLGAFWLANRWKRNTPEELAAFTDVMREESVETAAPAADPVDCGANYDGKGRTAILGVAAGVVAAAAGTPVVVHSGDRVPTQKQDAYRHVLDELGVRTDLDPTESADMVDDVGFGFYYQPNFNPGVDALSGRRDMMGVRTFLNTVETLANPADADVHLGSFYHLPFAIRMVDTLRTCESQSVERALFFQGMEGYDDVRPGTTVVAEARRLSVEVAKSAQQRCVRSTRMVDSRCPPCWRRPPSASTCSWSRARRRPSPRPPAPVQAGPSVRGR